MISEVLHITPWEQREQLTVVEFLDACDYIDEQHRRAEEAKEG